MVLHDVHHTIRTEAAICSKAAKRRRYHALTIRAHALQQGQALHGSDGGAWERVLRYPGGQERRICYPVSQLQEEEEEEVLSLAETADAETAERYSDWWGLERYYEFSTDEEDDQVVDSMVLPQEIAAPAPPQGLPSTPGELLRYINSPEYKAAQAASQSLVQSSYKILEHSPWVQTRTLFLLAVQQGDADTPLTYTLRTRVQRKGAEDELSKVLGRRQADGSSLIRVEAMRDGILAFEDEADCHRYASMLEADGTKAFVMDCDGHSLFKEAGNAQAVVVLIHQCSGLACHLPMPQELASSLRGQRSLEEIGGD